MHIFIYIFMHRRAISGHEFEREQGGVRRRDWREKRGGINNIIILSRIKKYQ